LITPHSVLFSGGNVALLLLISIAKEVALLKDAGFFWQLSIYSCPATFNG